MQNYLAFNFELILLQKQPSSVYINTFMQIYIQIISAS